MQSHASDGTVESCWQWRYRGDLAATQCRCRVVLAMVRSSHVGDNIVEAMSDVGLLTTMLT
jgi:hypothetical protein